MEFTRKALECLKRLEGLYPGCVRLQAATRDSARLLVLGRVWEFEVADGLPVLKTSEICTVRALSLLAHLRAAEAILAVQAGEVERGVHVVPKKEKIRRLREPKEPQNDLFDKPIPDNVCFL